MRFTEELSAMDDIEVKPLDQAREDWQRRNRVGPFEEVRAETVPRPGEDEPILPDFDITPVPVLTSLTPKKPRLNGWFRIGIAISVLWVVVGGLWGNDIGIHQGDWVLSQSADCGGDPIIAADCRHAADILYQQQISGRWITAAVVAFVPLVLFWISVFILIYTIRWIVRGFRYSYPSGT